MTDPHIGREIDNFNFRALLDKYGYSAAFVASKEIEVLLDAVLIETLSLMRERGYLDERYIFSSNGNGRIGIRDTKLADDLSDVDQ